MSNKKRYRIEHDGTYFSMVIEIDHDVVTDKVLTEINEFWTRDKDRLDDAGGHVLKVVLKMLCQCVISLQIEYDYNVSGVRDMFNWDVRGKGQEGWPRMDGSEGFEIISISEPEFEPSDITIEEVMEE